MQITLLLLLGLGFGFLCGYFLAHNAKNRAVMVKATEMAGQLKEIEYLKLALAEEVRKCEKLSEQMRADQSAMSELRVEKINAEALCRHLTEKMNGQSVELERMHEKLNLEFERLANRILETKTEKFVDVNKANLKSILEPLDKKIADFQQLVQTTYASESEGRTRLETVIREMQKINVQISAEANHLATALKGQAKTQGGWGEMILRRIFEQSGLTEGREYRLQDFLKDEHGQPLKSETEGKKMQPDAVVMYPDDREVIIDSKVSLNAFLRFNESEDPLEQKQFAKAHVQAVRNHIAGLSAKGYDDYHKSLDFVIMFIPNEAAFNLAMQGDPELWSYAYDKKILLSSPMNLITSLKMFEDLWRRDDQSKNAMEIADLGAKLYDKFTGFVNNLEDVGKKMESAKLSYDKAFSQLVSGKGNLVNQTQKLVQMGAKAKKQLKYVSEETESGFSEK